MKEQEKETFKINVEPGEYPFPILDGADESRYLTWVRNNANYMAVRGFLDYMRAIGVLVRGIIINFVVLLPVALIISSAIAWWYQTRQPFELTFIVLIVATAIILLYPLLTPLWNILRHRKRLETGSDSSVKPRSRLEQLFGILMLLVLTIAAFEFLAASLEPLHRIVYESEGNWTLFFSVMPAALAIFATADKLLASLAGLARKFMMAFIGILGVLVPLFFILLVSDYLVFNPPHFPPIVLAFSFAIPVIMTLMIFLAFIMLCIGWLRSRYTKNSNVFTFRDVSKMFAFFIGVVLYVWVLYQSMEKMDKHWFNYENSLAEFWEQIYGYQQAAQDGDAETQDEFSLQTIFQELASWFDTDENQSIDSKERLREDLYYFIDDIEYRPDVPKLRRLFDNLEVVKVEYSEKDLKRFENENSMGMQPLSELLNVKSESDLAIVAINYYDEIASLYNPQFAYPDCEAVGVVSEPVELDSEQCYTDDFSEIDYFLVNYSLVANWEDCFDGKDSCGGEFFKEFDEAYKELTLLAVYHSRDYPYLFNAESAVRIRDASFYVNFWLLVLIAVPLWLITRFTVDVNLTSIHGLYRDRLASAFLVGADTKGDVDIEKDLDLGEICRYEAGSTAPYHLINVALNLQGSKTMGVRDRQSDFFIFSKKFIGGNRTGYCRGETMELFFPQMGLATAMAISAAAASPNMGRSTSPALVIIMTLFNIRLGYWLPNPKRLETWLYKRKGVGGKEGGYVFDDVFAEELEEITRRWENAYETPERHQSSECRPTIAHSLVGVGFSGGGIRSATINLGITQALEKNGVFKHIDYMSTVSGGGYLGSSISALMRQKEKTESEITGTVEVLKNGTGKTVVSVTPKKSLFSFLDKSKSTPQPCTYQFADYGNLAVKNDGLVRKGQRLLNPTEIVDANNLSFSPYYRWRVPPRALLREIAGKLNEDSKWVNVSDGGHIENLAGIELLRRRCKYIVIGDGEADPEHHFNGLAILIQTARIDLGVHIDIKANPLRLNKKGLSKAHWVAGRIHYPGEKEKGYLLYLKSSLIGDEDEVIKHYKKTQPSFPHESTADQFFGEGQFEAYRSLGQHIGESLFEKSDSNEEQAEPDKKKTESDEKKTMSFVEFEEWFKGLSPDT